MSIIGYEGGMMGCGMRNPGSAELRDADLARPHRMDNERLGGHLSGDHVP